MEIRGAVGLVSGGASGLGEAVVRALVATGAQAVIADVNEARFAPKPFLSWRIGNRRSLLTIAARRQLNAHAGRNVRHAALFRSRRSDGGNEPKSNDEQPHDNLPINKC